LAVRVSTVRSAGFNILTIAMPFVGFVRCLDKDGA
jgi:hypothetical protein